MRDLIPTVKITNHAGVKSIKDGMKSNSYAHIEREKKPTDFLNYLINLRSLFL